MCNDDSIPLDVIKEMLALKMTGSQSCDRPPGQQDSYDRPLSENPYYICEDEIAVWVTGFEINIGVRAFDRKNYPFFHTISIDERQATKLATTLIEVVAERERLAAADRIEKIQAEAARLDTKTCVVEMGPSREIDPYRLSCRRKMPNQSEPIEAYWLKNPDGHLWVHESDAPHLNTNEIIARFLELEKERKAEAEKRSAYNPSSESTSLDNW